MPFVRFFEDTILQDEHRRDPEKRTVFLGGQAYEMSDASAQHWLVRNKVELVEVEPEPLFEAEEVPVDEETKTDAADKKKKKKN